MELDTVVCGDCLDVMAEMPDRCINLVVTDPPFKVESLDFPKFLEECRRVMTQKAAIYCYWSSKGITYFEPLFRQAFRLHNIIAIRTKNFICHPWDKTAFDFKWTPVFFGSQDGFDYKIAERCYAGGYDTGDAWDCVMPQSNWKKERRVHPFQKPLSSIERMIKTSSLFDDLVFDPFMGSGTTAIAALKLGRHFYGCDINPDYVKLANERIEKTRLEMSQMEMAL